MIGKLALLAAATVLASTSAQAICPYDANCLNNPYSGRDNSSQGIQSAPFGSGPGQYNPSYAVNPNPNSSTYNPYSPPPSADVNEEGIPLLSKGLGVGLVKGAGSLKDLNLDLLGDERLGGRLDGTGSLPGVDVDRRIQSTNASKRALPNAAGSLKGVDPDMQR
jgi:hypothetical protein